MTTLDLSKIVGTNITVTGANSFSQNATVLGVTPDARGETATVTYQFTAPGGGFVDGANYTLTLNASQIATIGGTFIAQTTLGAIAVNLTPTSTAEIAQWKANISANGGTITTAQETAVSNFIIASKTSGTWTKYKLLLLPMGDLLAATNYLIYPGSVVRATNNGFVSADVTATDGIKGNVTSGTKYLNSGYNFGSGGLNLDSQISNFGLFYFTRGSVTVTNDFVMGAATVNGSNLIFDAIGRYNGATREGGGIGTASFAASANNTSTNSTGLLMVNNESTRVTKFYVNGSLNATGSAGVNGLQNQNMYLMASNQQGTLSSPTTRNMLATGVTIGMTAALVPTMYSELNALMTALGR